MQDKLAAKLIGDEKTFPLKHRIFNVLALIGIFMSFSAGIINIILKLGLVTVLVPIGCGVVTVFLYRSSIIGRKYKLPVIITVFMLSFVFFPTMWVINAGTYGSIPYYMVINAGIIAVLLVGAKRLVVFALYCMITAGLILFERLRPDYIIGYESESIRYFDLSFGLFVCLLSNFVFFAVLIDSYINERQKSGRYYSVLRKQNKKIEAKNRMLEESCARLQEAKEHTEHLNRLLIKEKQKLHKLSITDYLTGAFNKMFITMQLEKEIEAARKIQKKLTVVMIDLDNFKSINDKYGHLFGDYALKRISGAIVNNLRQKDLVGRYGGDEFLIILPGTGSEDGYAIAERIRKSVWSLNWDNDFRVTISGSVVEFSSIDQLDGLLQKADKLLYQAKCNGKNRIEKDFQGTCAAKLEEYLST
ncbi:MAG: GGDEF domain-containing protein [Dethiobacteria bacterium]|jgi:diguanylate cyclase (GGDEF)-like protein